MLAIKSDTRYRLKQKESNTQRFERNLLKQSKKASHVLLTPLPFQFYFPPQFFLFPFSTILLFSLLNVFIPSSTIFYYFPSSMFFIPLLHLHLLIYSIYFSIHKYIDLLATLHRPHIDPTSINKTNIKQTWRILNNAIEEEGMKKNEEGNVVNKDSLLSLNILIDFFQIAVYLTLFVLNGISCLILLLAIISCVFNQLILVKLFVL